MVLEGAGLAFLRSSADVLSIEEDGQYQAFTSVTQCVQLSFFSPFLSFCSHFVNRADAPWGLARLSQDDRLNRSPTALDYQYKYDDVIVNVDAYVIGELTAVQMANCTTKYLSNACFNFAVRYW